MAKASNTSKEWYGLFVFRSVPAFVLPQETWDIDHVEAEKDTIQAYFRNGPAPLETQFLYKRTVRHEIETRFPSDRPIRDVIDQTILGLQRVNTHLVWGKKFLALLALALLLSGTVWTERELHVDPLGLNRFAVVVAVIAVAMSAVLISTISSLNACMQDICMKFQAAFQQYTNTTFNFFKEAIFHVDQEEHEVAYEEWPFRARQWFVSALWQPYRIEYAVLYFQQAMHSAENNWNGIFGVELIGNLASGVILVAGTAVLAALDVLAHKLFGVGFFDLPLSCGVAVHIALWLSLVWVSFDICAVLLKVSVEIFARPGLHRLGNGLRLVLLGLSLLAPLALWSVFSAAGPHLQEMFPYWREYLLAVTLNGLLAITYFASTNLDVIREKLDTQKWHEAGSFNIGEVLGDQVFRDKNRINEEKFRQKDTKVEPPKRRPVGG
jgi:hypothetical protein